MKKDFWTSFWGRVLCLALRHSGQPTGVFIETNKEMCDCPKDHRYIGCMRCRLRVDFP